MLYRMPSVSFSFPFLPSLCMTKRRLCQRKCLYLTERTLCLVHKHDCLWRADDTQAETVTFLILSDPAWKGCNMLTLTRFFFFLLSPTRFGTARCYSSALFYLFIFFSRFSHWLSISTPFCCRCVNALVVSLLCQLVLTHFLQILLPFPSCKQTSLYLWTSILLILKNI